MLDSIYRQQTLYILLLKLVADQPGEHIATYRAVIAAKK